MATGALATNLHDKPSGHGPEEREGLGFIIASPKMPLIVAIEELPAAFEMKTGAQ